MRGSRDRSASRRPRQGIGPVGLHGHEERQGGERHRRGPPPSETRPARVLPARGCGGALLGAARGSRCCGSAPGGRGPAAIGQLVGVRAVRRARLVRRRAQQLLRVLHQHAVVEHGDARRLQRACRSASNRGAVEHDVVASATRPAGATRSRAAGTGRRARPPGRRSRSRSRTSRAPAPRSGP